MPVGLIMASTVRLGKRQIVGCGQRWKNNIKMAIKEIECEGVNCIIWIRQGKIKG
jgi:hypothetical protein